MDAVSVALVATSPKTCTALDVSQILTHITVAISQLSGQCSATAHDIGSPQTPLLDDATLQVRCPVQRARFARTHACRPKLRSSPQAASSRLTGSMPGRELSMQRQWRCWVPHAWLLRSPTGTIQPVEQGAEVCLAEATCSLGGSLLLWACILRTGGPSPAGQTATS